MLMPILPSYMKLEVFIVVKIPLEVFWVVMLSSDAMLHGITSQKTST
jgi:hypothetical protein